MSLSSKTAPTLRDLVVKTIHKLEGQEKRLKAKMELESPIGDWIEVRKEAQAIIGDKSLDHKEFAQRLTPLAAREKEIKRRMDEYNKVQEGMVKTIEDLCSVQFELGRLRQELWFMDRR